MMTSVVAPADPPQAPDLSAVRHVAMAHAVTLHVDRFDGDSADHRDLLDTAIVIHYWLAYGPTFPTIIFAPVLDQVTGEATGNVFGGPMSQLHTDEKVTGTIRALDSRGFEVPDDPATESDNVTWTLQAGGEGVATLEVSGDTRSATLSAVAPGSTVLTADIATPAGNRVVTQALDVIPGDVASLEIVMGTPVKQDGTTPVGPGA